MTYCVTTQTCQNGGLPVTGNQLSNCQVLSGSVAVTKFIPGTQGTVHDFDVSFTAARTAVHGDRFLQCTYNGATLKLAAALTVYDTPPVITNVVPGTLTPGVPTSVTIAGSNFGPYPGSVIVSQDPQGNLAIQQQPSRSAWNDNSVTVSVTPSSSASGQYDLKILSSGVYVDGSGNDFNTPLFLVQPGTNDQAQSNPKPITVQGQPPTVASLQVSQPSTPDAVTGIAPAVTAVPITDTSSAFATENPTPTRCVAGSVLDGCLITVLKDSGTVTVTAAGIQPLGSGGQIQWVLQRDSHDTVDSAFVCLHLPVACIAAVAAGSQVTFDPSSAGNFRLIAYFDANGNGQFDEGEQLRVARIAVVRFTIQNGSSMTLADTLYPDSFADGTVGASSAVTQGGIVISAPMRLSATYLMEGGGTLRTIGTDPIRLGNVGNLISVGNLSDTFEVTYPLAGVGNEDPGGTTPMVDSNMNPPAGGLQPFRGDSQTTLLAQPGTPPGTVGLLVRLDSSDGPAFSWKPTFKNTGILWAQTAGGNAFQEYAVAFCLTFPGTYVSLSQAKWSLAVNGYYTGVWADSGSIVTGDSALQQVGAADKVQVLGPSFKQTVNMKYIP
jgi:hypothetical protein